MGAAIEAQVAAWQARGHEIGMLTFSPTEKAAREFPYYEIPNQSTFLGLMEADALCLLSDGSLCVYDHEVPSRVLCQAATDQTKFLSLLAVLEEYFDKCAEDDTYWEDETAAAQIRDRCTEIAGGDEYAAFITSLVGV